jgi:hypothetical protein
MIRFSSRLPLEGSSLSDFDEDNGEVLFINLLFYVIQTNTKNKLLKASI